MKRIVIDKRCQFPSEKSKRLSTCKSLCNKNLEQSERILTQLTLYRGVNVSTTSAAGVLLGVEFWVGLLYGVRLVTVRAPVEVMPMIGSAMITAGGCVWYTSQMEVAGVWYRTTMYDAVVEAMQQQGRVVPMQAIPDKIISGRLMQRDDVLPYGWQTCTKNNLLIIAASELDALQLYQRVGAIADVVAAPVQCNSLHALADSYRQVIADSRANVQGVNVPMRVGDMTRLTLEEVAQQAGIPLSVAVQQQQRLCDEVLSLYALARCDYKSFLAAWCGDWSVYRAVGG